MKNLTKRSIYVVLIFTLLISVFSFISGSSHSLAIGGYTVIFDANGGNVSPSSKIINPGDKYGELPTPTKEGYKFAGWTLPGYRTLQVENPFYDNYFGRNVLRLAPGDPTSNGLFGDGDRLVFDIQFSGTVPIGADINDNDLTTSDYTIDGDRIFGEVTISDAHYRKWGRNSYSFLDINCQDPVSSYTVYEFKLYTGINSETVITSDTTFDATDEVRLIAKWEPIQYWTVDFETNGAKEQIGSPVVEDGQTVVKPTDPTKDNCTFGGWYSDEDCTKEFDFSTPITSDMKIYAKWIPQYHDVTLVLSDMNVNDDVDLGEGEIVVEILYYKELLTYEENPDGDSANFYNKDGKLLFVVYEDGRIVIADGITSADNIEYTLTDEEKEMFAVSGIFVNKVILSFGNEAVVYEVVEGANQTYTINKDDKATFKINALFNLFENGGKVYVDDAEVDSSNYTSESGSTIITFNKNYMDSIEVGQHTLKVVFNNGGTATTNFTVAKEETPVDNPKTGDIILLWISILTISTLGIVGTVIQYKKSK